MTRFFKMYLGIKKLGLLGILFWLASVAVSGQAVRPLDALFDPAANETTVYLSPKFMPLFLYPVESYIPPDSGMWVVKPESLVVTVYFKTPGNKPDVPASIKLRFDSRSSGEFRYKNERKLVVSADDETFDLGQIALIKSELDRSSRGMRGAYYEETLEASIKLEEYSRIVNAKKVQMTVGKTKFRVPEKKLKELRSYTERLKS